VTDIGLGLAAGSRIGGFDRRRKVLPPLTFRAETDGRRPIGFSLERP
jgi:hypothetical protein